MWSPKTDEYQRLVAVRAQAFREFQSAVEVASKRARRLDIARVVARHPFVAAGVACLAGFSVARFFDSKLFRTAVGLAFGVAQVQLIPIVKDFVAEAVGAVGSGDEA